MKTSGKGVKIPKAPWLGLVVHHFIFVSFTVFKMFSMSTVVCKLCYKLSLWCQFFRGLLLDLSS